MECICVRVGINPSRIHLFCYLFNSQFSIAIPPLSLLHASVSRLSLSFLFPCLPFPSCSYSPFLPLPFCLTLWLLYPCQFLSCLLSLLLLLFVSHIFIEFVSVSYYVPQFNASSVFLIITASKMDLS